MLEKTVATTFIVAVVRNATRSFFSGIPASCGQPPVGARPAWRYLFEAQSPTMKSMNVSSLAMTICSMMCSAQGIAGASDAETPRIPRLKFEKYTLPNGLDVILHEDHAVPIVGVNVWYHVGSKNERSGRTGFAHLF
jgi:hypothetical protein